MEARTPSEVSGLLKRVAVEVGFDLVGIARAEPSAHGEAYRAWIAAGKHGEMGYMAKEIDQRVDLTKKFPWARTVLCVGLGYYQEKQEEKEAAGVGKIARYAWGRDYHKVMEAKLREMERRVRAEVGAPLQARIYVDTGPILEREFAMRAGLGWVGKHTLLIHPKKGSWFLLGEMVLSVEAAPDEAVEDHCGTCRRCIEACPTGAIEPYSVDGSKCISYLTIEHRGEIEEGLQEGMREAGYVVGCDICQEVCPFNRRAVDRGETTGAAADFAVRGPAPAVSLEGILNWQEAEWEELTRGRAFRRVKLGMWKRNAVVLRGEASSRSAGEGVYHGVTEATAPPHGSQSVAGE